MILDLKLQKFKIMMNNIKLTMSNELNWKMKTLNQKNK